MDVVLPGGVCLTRRFSSPEVSDSRDVFRREVYGVRGRSLS